jgi:hypothetical protein
MWLTVASIALASAPPILAHPFSWPLWTAMLVPGAKIPLPLAPDNAEATQAFPERCIWSPTMGPSVRPAPCSPIQLFYLHMRWPRLRLVIE